MPTAKWLRPFWFLTITLACQTLSAQFGGGALRVDAGADIYKPLLQQALTAELHFVKKVCQPSDQQFERIHREGLAGVADLAETYRDLQRRRQNPQDWPDPNMTIAFWLYQTIKRIFPEDVAREYQAEIAARRRDSFSANVGMMVNLIDGHVLLDPAQREKLHSALARNWQADWSTGTIVFTYPQYASVPFQEALEPHLTDLQLALWAYRVKRPAIRLSWQDHFKLNQMLLKLEPFESPKDDAATEQEPQP